MKPENNTMKIEYIYNHALFDCDCGNYVMAVEKAWGTRLYEGHCSKCGKDWKLKDGKIICQKLGF